MYPTAIASDVFLVIDRYCEISGGTITRNACGNTTSRSANPLRRPNASAASV